MRNYPTRYKAPKADAPDAADLPGLFQQARAVLDEAEAAHAERDASTVTERLRKLEEIAVFARYVTLATR